MTCNATESGTVSIRSLSSGSDSSLSSSSSYSFSSVHQQHGSAGFDLDSDLRSESEVGRSILGSEISSASSASVHRARSILRMWAISCCRRWDGRRAWDSERKKQVALCAEFCVDMPTFHLYSLPYFCFSSFSAGVDSFLSSVLYFYFPPFVLLYALSSASSCIAHFFLVPRLILISPPFLSPPFLFLSSSVLSTNSFRSPRASSRHIGER